MVAWPSPYPNYILCMLTMLSFGGAGGIDTLTLRLNRPSDIQCFSVTCVDSVTEQVDSRQDHSSHCDDDVTGDGTRVPGDVQGESPPTLAFSIIFDLILSLNLSYPWPSVNLELLLSLTFSYPWPSVNLELLFIFDLLLTLSFSYQMKWLFTVIVLKYIMLQWCYT